MEDVELEMFAKREVLWLSAEGESKHAAIAGSREMECGHHMAGIFAQPLTRHRCHRCRRHRHRRCRRCRRHRHRHRRCRRHRRATILSPAPRYARIYISKSTPRKVR